MSGPANGTIGGSLVGAVRQHESTERRRCGWCGIDIKVSARRIPKNESPACKTCVKYENIWKAKRGSR